MNPITTANKLKTLRTLNGLTAEQVAEKASLNLDDYKNLELGTTAVSEEKLTKACNALGVDIKEWFNTDNSNVYINNGEITGEGNQCENCYFYNRSDKDAEMMESVAEALKLLANKLDFESLALQIKKMMKEDGIEE